MNSMLDCTSGSSIVHGNVVSDTIAEWAETPTRERTLQRLRDWRSRVHALYDQIEHALGADYSYDRTGTHQSWEERVQESGLGRDDVPPIDILRIERSGHLVAVIQPRGLWIIGANGRLDLVLTTKTGGRRLFILYDHSSPMDDRTDWRIVRPSDGPRHFVFEPGRLRELLE
jgi:hypothetical protein